MSALCGYLAVKFSGEEGYNLLQILFFIGCLFFAIVGFATQVGLSKLYKPAFEALSNIPYQASIFVMIATLAIVFFSIIAYYFKLAGGVVWDRKTHEYRER